MAQNTTQQKPITGHCLRCRRPLRNPTTTGYGPTCGRRIRRAAADLADFTARQIDQARELLDDGAVIRLRSTVFITVSSDGAETYYSHPTNCNCPGGNKARRCYHMAAARIALAA